MGWEDISSVVNLLSFVRSSAMYCVAVWLVVFSEVCVAKMITFQWCNKYIQTQFERIMQLAGLFTKEVVMHMYYYHSLTCRWYSSWVKISDNHYVVELSTYCWRVEYATMIVKALMGKAVSRSRKHVFIIEIDGDMMSILSEV